MEMTDQAAQIPGTPELTAVGKRIEMLRIERGLSKQQLARAAGISRQQLWRVLAGKSELTSSLCERLAFVLNTDIAVLRDAAAEAQAPRGTLAGWFSAGTATGPAPGAMAAMLPGAVASAPPATFAEFVGGTAFLRHTLGALPFCEDGAALKRAVLDAIEDIAIARGVALAPEFFELRRAVIAREL